MYSTRTRSVLLSLILAAPLFDGCLRAASLSGHYGPGATHRRGRRLAAGSRHTCVLRPWGGVACWGSNDAGQLGDGTQSDRMFPVRVRGLDDAVALAAGERHSCAVLRSGEVACWGSNNAGQLGLRAGPELLLAPQRVPGLSGVVELAAGTGYTCARTRSGDVLCWGTLASEVTSRYSAIVAEQIAFKRIPTRVPGLSRVSGFAAGYDHLCALHSSGEVSCWGRGRQGQLGDGAEQDRFTPTRVKQLRDAVAISAGNDFTCALRRSGGVSCWGENYHGQLGVDRNVHPKATTPQDVAGVRAVEIATGAEHACARLRGGNVTCWGQNHGDASPTTQPIHPLPWQPEEAQHLKDTVELAAGELHTCALRASGEVDCWGANDSGQLGRDDRPEGSSTPRSVVGITRAIALTAGEEHTCALLVGGEVRCWGDNVYKQSGGFEQPFSSTPMPIDGLAKVTSVGAGGAHTCAAEADGQLRCFGKSFSTCCSHVWPPRPLGGALRFKAVALGDAYGCGLAQEGHVHCWGRNDNGQLGRGTLGERNPSAAELSPAPVLGIEQAVGITAGMGHSCALLSTGSIACWGYNYSGQCAVDPAQGQTLPRPVRVEGLRAQAKALAAGSSHNCALLHSGEVFCWGRNDYGQLGEGTHGGSRSAPVAVKGIKEAVAIAGSAFDSCAVLATGSVLCWGRGFGATPMPVADLSSAVEVVLGMDHYCARLRSGAVRCWGDNSRGQLGDGSALASHAAAPVHGL